VFYLWSLSQISLSSGAGARVLLASAVTSELMLEPGLLLAPPLSPALPLILQVLVELVLALGVLLHFRPVESMGHGIPLSREGHAARKSRRAHSQGAFQKRSVGRRQDSGGLGDPVSTGP